MEPQAAATAAPPPTPAPPAPAPKKPLPDSEDINKAIAELPDNRKGPASALYKSFVHALEEAQKAGTLAAAVRDPSLSIRAMAITCALDVERALHDMLATSKDYASQARTLAFNIKRNPDLSLGLVRGTLSAGALAHMKTEQLAPKELQREIQGIREKVEKQSIRITTDAPPRTRHTHKGEELVDDGEHHFVAEDESPTVMRRPSMPSSRPQTAKTPTEKQQQQQQQQLPRDSMTQPSPRSGGADFDLGKVLSSVKSPAAGGHARRPSQSVRGPGEDADVDRMLQAEPESPPYSPKEDADGDHDMATPAADDEEVVWRGNVIMSTIANFPCVARWAAGGNIYKAIGMPWSELFHTPQLGVIGRIEADKAIPYLCGLRYNPRADVVVTSLEPGAPGFEAQFESIVNYFLTKQRYGVLNVRGTGCIRDAYLVPVPVDEDGYPEFLLNFLDNTVPRQGRTRTGLLVVFVCIDAGTPTAQSSSRSSAERVFSPTTPHPSGAGGASGGLLSGPAVGDNAAGHTNGFATIDGALAGDASGVPSASTDAGALAGGGGGGENASGAAAAAAAEDDKVPSAAATNDASAPSPSQPVTTPAAIPTSHMSGQSLALQLLGPDLAAAPTLSYILPNASSMAAQEWDTLRKVFENDPKTRYDLNHLSAALAREAELSKGQQAPAKDQGAAASAA
jgi:hypothetical protein